MTESRTFYEFVKIKSVELQVKSLVLRLNREQGIGEENCQISYSQTITWSQQFSATNAIDIFEGDLDGTVSPNKTVVAPSRN